MAKSIMLNGVLTALPAEVFTLEQLLTWRNIPTQGTAVAINGRVIPARMHSVTQLNEASNVMVLSAAYGG
ncbi:MAG: sulfur carrier protein ThiS [Muribaculaceae bacterium]|nr:sulfur carrier protein ThiS [Muribaculaceae bacterium]MDE7510148.1 sulfur carrier protein ThiS [Muribaculaceae bacterium]